MIAKLKRIYSRLKDYKYTRISYAQEGEDLLLDRIFKSKQNGFYVDVGAYHPKRYSNTYLFYEKGWQGINIDPSPNNMLLFNKIRPRDLNLEIGVSEELQTLTYYIYNEPAFNGFVKDFSEENTRGTSFKLIGQNEIQTFPLYVILDKYLPANQKISFMSVDVEGLDLEVLKSNNWEKYRPEVILVEMLDTFAQNIPNSDINKFLVTMGYRFCCKTPHTAFYQNTI
jgi:FkbM family methyltransferase